MGVLKKVQRRSKSCGPFHAPPGLPVPSAPRESKEHLRDDCIPSTVSPSTRKVRLPFVPVCKIPYLIGEIERTSIRAVGGGGQADIHLGVWKRASVNTEAVAIKVIRVYNSNIGCPPPDKSKLLREAKVWVGLTHPNVTPFYGIWYDPEWPDAPCFIMPYFSSGNVRVYLKEYPYADRLKLFRQAAAGVVYLHGLTTPIIHGDIKSMNILINDKGEACITDFGHARALECSGFTSICCGSYRWTAPEVFMYDSSLASPAIDVWALGMTGLEIFSDRFPFYKIQPWTVMYKVTNGELPEREDYPEVDGDIWDVLALSWDFDPVQRPSMPNLLARIDMVACRRSDLHLADIVCGKDHRQTNGRGNTSSFFSKSHGILSNLNICGRDRAVSFSEGSVFPSRSKTAPYPHQWEDCRVRGSASKDFQNHELLHDTTHMGRLDRIHVINLPQ